MTARVIDGLAFAITVLSAVGGLVVIGSAATRRYRQAAFLPLAGVIQTGLLAQAVLDVVALARGHRPAELATHLAYLVVSVVVLPLALVETRRDDGPWSAALVAGALLVVAVLVVRMAATWR